MPLASATFCEEGMSVGGSGGEEGGTGASLAGCSASSASDSVEVVLALVRFLAGRPGLIKAARGAICCESSSSDRKAWGSAIGAEISVFRVTCRCVSRTSGKGVGRSRRFAIARSILVGELWKMNSCIRLSERNRMNLV